MKKTIIALSIVCLITGMFSCSEDFLDQQPIGAFGESILSSESGINGMLIGIYTLLNEGSLDAGPDQQLNGTIHGGEAFKGSDAGDQPQFLEFNKFGVTTGNSSVTSLWRNVYNGVARCNAVLALLPSISELSDAEKVEIEAETRFLRAYFYFRGKRAFKNIPWIDETATDVRVPNTVNNDGTTYVNCWPEITADMDFARKNLPATQKQLARPNKWAAEAFYAKILIYRANEGDYANGYTEALAVLNDIIANGVTSKGEKYGLVANYHDLFNCKTENNKEDVWVVACSVNDGTPTSGWTASPNGDQKSVWIQSQSTSGPGLGRGWGFMNPTPFYADMFRVDASGLPYLDYYATNPHRLKDDYGMPGNTLPVDTFQIDTAGVDPRLDWTIGRRNIPFLDYGNFPGKSWIRNQDHGGPYMLKKWYIWKSEDGTFTAPGNSNTAMDIPVIRFADVLLFAAECEARVGSLDKARDYVNQVRKRMQDNSTSPTHWVKKADGVTNAANYRIGLYPSDGSAKDAFTSREKALTAILYERALELGTEGHRFYDVARFGKGEELFNLFITTDKVRFDYLKEAVYTENPDRWLPIPRDAIDRSKLAGKATLTQNPGY